METKKKLIDSIKNIEKELNSFEEEKNISNDFITTSKCKLIEDVKSGVFDEMLNEIKQRQEKKKKESIWTKIFK